jgi:hypothetical protein
LLRISQVTTRDSIDTKFDRFGFEFNGYCGNPS